MKFIKVIILFVFALAGTSSLAQQITFDSVMQKVSKGRPFVLVLLKSGKAMPADKATAEKLHADHLVRLFQLEKDKKISIFGPVTNDTSTVRGLIIFNDPDLEKARKELETDPYIKQGYLKVELYNWFTIPGQSIPK